MSRQHVAEIYDWAGLLVAEYVLKHYSSDTRILDVGAGQGKYGIMLGDYAHVDACEIWEPYVVENDLRAIYRRVIVRDFVDVADESSTSGVSEYDLVVMGDVLEHINRPAAQRAIERVTTGGADVIVVVPYEYPQDEEDGNVYQRHVQDDLTPELMAREYPMLQLVALETRDLRPFKGMYVGRARG